MNTSGKPISSVAVPQGRHTPRGAARRIVIPAAAILAYAAVRMLWLPVDSFSYGFTHDSAYLATAARNLLDGKGLVNDASWLVFLHPASLPMPFHNANPLYPVLTAALAKAAGTDVFRAGFLISALSSVALVAALAAIVGRWLPAAYAVAAAFLIALFPALYATSAAYLPDALCLALTTGSAAMLIRAPGAPMSIGAGVLLGLAWLARSTAALMAPAAVLYLLLACGWRRGIRAALLFGAAAAAAASPWLVHTARVWGSPLRSDNSYYLLQLYHARSSGGPVERYWHATAPPPSMAAIVRKEPGEILGFWAAGAPKAARALAGGWLQGSVPAAMILAALFILAAASTGGVARTPAFAAGALYAAAALAVFAFRAESAEPRYFSFLTVLVLLWVAAGTVRALRHGPGRTWKFLAIAATAGYTLWAAPEAVARGRFLASRNPQAAGYRAAAAEVNKTLARGRPVIVGDKPYLYSLETGAPSLSIPDASDDYLERYMLRNGAEYVFLTRAELQFWRPAWLRAAPQEFRLAMQDESNYVFQLKQADRR